MSSFVLHHPYLLGGGGILCLALVALLAMHRRRRDHLQLPLLNDGEDVDQSEVDVDTIATKLQAVARTRIARKGPAVRSAEEARDERHNDFVTALRHPGVAVEKRKAKSAKKFMVQQRVLRLETQVPLEIPNRTDAVSASSVRLHCGRKCVPLSIISSVDQLKSTDAQLASMALADKKPAILKEKQAAATDSGWLVITYGADGDGDGGVQKLTIRLKQEQHQRTLLEVLRRLLCGGAATIGAGAATDENLLENYSI